MPQGAPKFSLPNFFVGVSVRMWGEVRKLTGSKVGISAYREGACQLTKVGMWAGWVAHFANSSRGTPIVSRLPPRGSSANFVNERLWDQIGGQGPADLTMLWPIARTNGTLTIRG